MLILLVGLIALTATFPRTAVGQTTLSELSEEERQQMQDFLAAGKEQYEKGNFESAIPFLKKAHEIYPNPAFHYRIALAYERSDHPKKALEHYREFLEGEPETDKRGQVEKTIERLEARIIEQSRANIRIDSTPAGAEVSIGSGSNETRGRTPVQMQVEPGEITLVLEKPGRVTVSEQVDVEAGKSYEYNYSLPPSPSEPDAGARRVRILPLIFAGAGTLGLTTYVIGETSSSCLIWKGITTANKLCTKPEYQEHVRKSGALLGTAFGVGIAGWTTAGILWALGGFRHAPTSESPPESSAGLELRPSLGPSGLGISGTF